VPEQVDHPTAEDAPPIDPGAVDSAYRYHQARRRARVERRRHQRRAGMRFWLGVLVLVAASVALALLLWQEVERLFGL
jgi:hypothetical protein